VSVVLLLVVEPDMSVLAVGVVVIGVVVRVLVVDEEVVCTVPFEKERA